MLIQIEFCHFFQVNTWVYIQRNAKMVIRTNKWWVNIFVVDVLSLWTENHSLIQLKSISEFFWLLFSWCFSLNNNKKNAFFHFKNFMSLQFLLYIYYIIYIKGFFNNKMKKNNQVKLFNFRSNQAATTKLCNRGTYCEKKQCYILF